MQVTNINITSEGKVFPYAIEYIKEDIFEDFEWSIVDTGVEFKTQLSRNGNVWDYQKLKDSQLTKSNRCKIRLYIPEFSVGVYERNVKYVLDIYTHLADKKVVLGSFLVDYNDFVAVPEIIRFQDQMYYECVEFNIVDPTNVLYSDEFSELRTILKDDDRNNDGTILLFNLHAVIQDDNIRILDGYTGGQNGISMTRNDDYLQCSTNWLENEVGCGIQCTLKFNHTYNGDLIEYMQNTYGWSDDIDVKYVISITDGGSGVEEIYVDNYNHLITSDILRQMASVTYGKEIDWGYWSDGMQMVVSAILIDSGVEKMILKSTPLPLTQNRFSKILIPDNKRINIEEYFEDMNINVINTIQKSTLEYDIPDNSKSNIIIPVFYKSTESGTIVIHPEVNENLCINLDQYKAKVDSFVLQVENIKFHEIGTTSAGTIFKVVGNMLPRQITSGTYYILNQNGDLVTTGKYTYEL